MLTINKIKLTVNFVVYVFLDIYECVVHVENARTIQDIRDRAEVRSKASGYVHLILPSLPLCWVSVLQLV